MRKIILSADGACDIGNDLAEKYHVKIFHYHIQLGEKSYKDMVEIKPDDIYKSWREEGILARTAAVTPEEYVEYFREWVRAGYDVVHIGLGSGLTSSYQNCELAAFEVGHVYPVDSRNLSTGMGHIVLQAAKMIESGMEASDIQRRLNELRSKSHASFIVDTLEFLKAGGRCSSLTAFSAGILNIKPCIEVDYSLCGSMHVGKKYRGSMDKVLKKYVQDQLEGRTDLDKECIFITHSGSPGSDIELVRSEIKKYAQFDQIHVTRASSTISAHCGPRTLGILYMTVR